MFGTGTHQTEVETIFQVGEVQPAFKNLGFQLEEKPSVMVGDAQIPPQPNL